MSISGEIHMAVSVTASEARIRFGRLLDRVLKGEEIVVTRHDKPVVRIIPAGRPEQLEVRAAAAGLRDLRRAIAVRREPAPGLTAAEIKYLVEEGRW